MNYGPWRRAGGMRELTDVAHIPDGPGGPQIMAIPTSPPPEHDCDSQFYWRLSYSDCVARRSDERPIEHPDLWVQHAANFWAASYDGWDGYEATADDIAIADAIRILKEDTLERLVLECWLLGEDPEPLETVAQRCHLPLGTVEAYSALIFDVRGARARGYHFRPPRFPMERARIPVWGITTTLKNVSWDSEELEQTIGVLLHVEGPTMLEGLPERDGPMFVRELQDRFQFASTLLPKQKTWERRLNRFYENYQRDLFSDHPSAVTIDETIEFLSVATIPDGLLEQIEQLRRKWSGKDEGLAEVDATCDSSASP